MAISHGTVWGYHKELRAGLETCRSCRDAWNAYRKARYIPRPRKEATCGTVGGYQKHRRLGQATCQACKKAWTEDWMIRHRKKQEASDEDK